MIRAIYPKDIKDSCEYNPVLSKVIQAETIADIISECTSKPNIP